MNAVMKLDRKQCRFQSGEGRPLQSKTLSTGLRHTPRSVVQIIATVKATMAMLVVHATPFASRVFL